MGGINKRKKLSHVKPVLRKLYNSPKLIEWGTITEVTQGANRGAADLEFPFNPSAYQQSPGRPKTVALT